MIKTTYFKMESFPTCFNDLLNAKASFKLVSTAYTKKIITEKFKLMFNDTGKEDLKVLDLINSVRKDAKGYLNTGGETRDSFISFFDLFNIPDPNEVITKVDVKSAYWDWALKKTILTDETNDKYLGYYDGITTQVAKNARLKALGCLATRKIIQTYIEGKLIKELNDTKTEPTRPLYMEICRGVDELMENCVQQIPECIYYYWDCIFVPKSFEIDVLEYFANLNYLTTVGQTKLEYVELGGSGWLLSRDDKKSYMTRSENRHLINA